MIIEDDERSGELLKEILATASYEAKVTVDAINGFEHADRHKPDLILLDLKLPLGGGFVTLQKLRVSTRTKNIPVIILTGSKDDKDKRQAQALGVKGYFYKPVDQALLLSKIAEILPGANLQKTSG